MTDSDRFWQQVRRTDGCWLWTGRKYRDGYGEFGFRADGRWRYTVAHRWSWREANGEIPEGMQVCHRCDNPPCVNPAHLFLGTALDNERDKITKGRRPSTGGEGNPRAAVSAADVEEIRRLVNVEHLSRRVVGKRFGISYAAVGYIVTGRSWGHVPLTTAPWQAKGGRKRTRPRDGSPIRCPRCQLVKPAEDFYPSQVKSGKGVCRSCRLSWREHALANLSP